MQSGNSIALSYLFTPKVLKELFYNHYSEHLIKVFNEFGMLDKLYQNLTLKDLFETSYKQLLKNYRNEYVFKNAIAEKILIGKHSIKSSSLFTELRVENSKADIAIFNGTSHAYEIKTNLDNFNRLSSQIDNYKKVFEYVNIVSVESKVDEIKSIVDDTIGIIILTDRYTLKTIRKARSDFNNLNKISLFNLLRKNEYLKIIENIYGNIPDVSNTKIYSTCKDLFIQLSVEEAHKEILKVLKNRNTHKNFIKTINNFPRSLKLAILEADLSRQEQLNFLDLLGREVNSIFMKRIYDVSSIS